MDDLRPDVEDEAEQRLRDMLSQMKKEGATDKEIIEQIFQAKQALEQQSPKRVSDPEAALAANIEHTEDGRYVASETWSIATGNMDETGRPIELEVTVEEPPNVEGMLTVLAQAYIQKGEEWHKAKESMVKAIVTDPEPLTIFKRLLPKEEVGKYLDKNNEDYPITHLDFFWKTTPSFRTNFVQRALPWLGLTEDFLRDFVKMSTGGDSGQQMSSILSPERIQSILSDLKENSETRKEDGDQGTSSGSTEPSNDEKTTEEPSESKTTSGSSGTSSQEPSEGKTPSSSPTQTGASAVKAVKSSDV